MFQLLLALACEHFFLRRSWSSRWTNSTRNVIRLSQTPVFEVSQGCRPNREDRMRKTTRQQHAPRCRTASSWSTSVSSSPRLTRCRASWRTGQMLCTFVGHPSSEQLRPSRPPLSRAASILHGSPNSWAQPHSRRVWSSQRNLWRTTRGPSS